MLALKLTQQTLHLCAMAAHLSPTEMNDLYESANLYNQVKYIVTDYIDDEGNAHPVVQLSDKYLHENYEFVTAESKTAFSEIRAI